MQATRHDNIADRRGAGKPDRLNLAQVVAELMRRSIFQGTLHPGEHLCQHKLAQEYGTSRVPVREALVQLGAEGLLDHDRHRGYFVKRYSWSDIEQLYKMRRWLEDQLLRSLPWPDTKTFDQIASLRSRANFGHQGISGEALDAVARLRRALFGLSQDRVLLREVSRLWVQLDRLRPYFATEGSYAFSDALRVRDRKLLLELHARERLEAERALSEAQSDLPGIWSYAA